MANTKNDINIAKYSPSLSGTKYNEPILKLLALEGPMTSTGLATKILEHKMVDGPITKKYYSDLRNAANKYYAKKKLSSIIDSRLHALEESKKPYVESEKALKGERPVNIWSLTFRGYILSLITIKKARDNWQVCFRHYRNKTPSCWREGHDKLIEHKASNNFYNVFFVKTLQEGLDDGRLDVIEADEILIEATEILLAGLDEALELVLSGKRPPLNKIRFGKVKWRRFGSLNREDRNSLRRFLRDPKVRNNLTKAANDIAETQKKKASFFEQIVNRLENL